MDLPLILDMAADGLGDAVALGSGDTAISYAGLRERARAGAAFLARTPAENTVFLGGNGPAFPIGLFASALAGRPFVPVNYRLPDADLRRILARTAPARAIVDDDMLDRASGIEGLDVIAAGAFMAETLKPAEAPASQGNPFAVLLFTSGTTGEPKAAVLRHANLASYVLSTVDFMNAAVDSQATLMSVPPYHIAGVSAVLTAVYAGRRMVQLAQFTPEQWIETVRAEQVTHAMVVPTMLGRILAELEETGGTLPSLRHLSYGGGRMPAALIERALELLPDVAFVNAYGLTETSSTIAVLTPDDHRTCQASDDPLVRQRLGSVGRPLPTLELQVTDRDEAPCAPGELGEIWVRGDQVSGEYIGRRAIRDDGWFPTNDHGWLDEDGYLFIEGRLDDVIVRGGENISPGEIEDVLRQHPAVLDVAVFGLPDDEWGEKIGAAVVTSEVVEAGVLINWVRERLRSTKAPEVIHFCAELPYNETGKLLRRALKAKLDGAAT
jgi:acyl-CoA synthetase (AMP-forming)/AMP-acid ligase II